ncbi:YueI family protein [Vagococcus vulneris]|uniref:DUF1694 domain-containing protein n=1 Tax=Vagococcus vulneris TaxID=1977869 RepID=A0A430A0J7_9ENTE|nr:YueI family protein [Vagococcus vulneris]RST99860.1 hypothetical protein CBF37_03825 [Vagococcus vulneris]
MSEKDVQDYLDKGLFGTPQVKPDEQRLFLGTFRERVALALTVSEMNTMKYDDLVVERINTFSKGHFLINANTNPDAQNHYMKMAQSYERNFRMVDTDIDNGPDKTIGLVYAVDTPINLDDVYVPNNYLSQKEAEQKKHHHLKDEFKKLI